MEARSGKTVRGSVHDSPNAAYMGMPCKSLTYEACNGVYPIAKKEGRYEIRAIAKLVGVDFWNMENEQNNECNEGWVDQGSSQPPAHCVTVNKQPI